MLRHTKGVFIALAALLPLWSAPALAAPRFGGITDLYVYPYIQYFHWTEENEGRKLLTESGPILGTGGAIHLDLVRSEAAGALTLRGKVEVFGGVVDYDGETQKRPAVFDLVTQTFRERPPLPVKTEVIYFGTRDELAVGWAFPIGKSRLEPFTGLGYRWWLRALQDSTTIDEQGKTIPVDGYTEVWESAYTKLGLTLSHTFDNNWRLFLEGGVSYPFYNTNSVDIVGNGTATVRPDGRWSAFGEAGIRTGKVRTAVFYQGYRTGQSPAVRISQTRAILQPRSTEDVVGVSVGYCFR